MNYTRENFNLMLGALTDLKHRVDRCRELLQNKQGDWNILDTKTASEAIKKATE